MKQYIIEFEMYRPFEYEETAHQYRSNLRQELLLLLYYYFDVGKIVGLSVRRFVVVEIVHDRTMQLAPDKMETDSSTACGYHAIGIQPVGFPCC